MARRVRIITIISTYGRTLELRSTQTSHRTAMPRIANISSGTSRILKATYRAIGERWRVLTVTILGICVPVYAMAWWLNIHDNLAANIAVTILVSMMPVAELASPSESLTTRGSIVWLSGFVLVAFAFFFGEEAGIRFLTFGAIFLVVALPWIWIFWQIVRHELILIPGFALALIAISIYWAGALVKDNLTFDLLLLPLPLVFVAAVLWAPTASYALKIARRNKNVRIRGPATQASAMGILFMPAFLVSFTIPDVLELSDPWSAACVTIVGVVLGAVVSEPLKNLFLEWGELARDKN